jgi:hypothetical protein
MSKEFDNNLDKALTGLPPESKMPLGFEKRYENSVSQLKKNYLNSGQTQQKSSTFSFRSVSYFALAACLIFVMVIVISDSNIGNPPTSEIVAEDSTNAPKESLKEESQTVGKSEESSENQIKIPNNISVAACVANFKANQSDLNSDSKLLIADSLYLDFFDKEFTTEKDCLDFEKKVEECSNNLLSQNSVVNKESIKLVCKE